MTAGTLKRLPTGIDSVTVPDFFSPSRWVRAEACPLSVWGPESQSLPASIEMIVGSVLHEVRRRYAAEPRRASSEAAVSAVLTEVVAAYEQRLRVDSLSVGLTPLAETFGRRKWLDAELRLRQWAVSLPREREPVAAHALVVERATSQQPLGPEVMHVSVGRERLWQVPSLRLRGRPDEAALAADGAIEIVDYKSGAIFERDGVRDSIVTQLQLYALMAEAATTRRVRLFVLGRERVAIEWDETERSKIVERLRLMRNRYSAGSTLPAEEASTPGVHCVGCGLRPQCPRYLREIPAWWPNTGDKPRPLPLDAWGTVRKSDPDAIGWTVHLDDPAGRRVTISGIDDRHGVQDTQPNQRLYAFTLAAGEDLFMHGRSLQPRAFHEHSAGPRWRSAPCPTFYVGPNADRGEDGRAAMLPSSTSTP